MKIKNAFLPLLVLATFLISGCSKDDNNDDNEQPALTAKQKLTAHTWQVEETYQNLTGTRIHYLRGGENTSGVNMGAIRLKFNADGTGTNTDVSGTTYNMTWNFTSAEESDLRLIINGTVIHDWIFTAIEENQIIQSTLVPANGLVVAKWTPVP